MQQLSLGFVFCPMDIPGQRGCNRVTSEFVLLSDSFLAVIDILHHQELMEPQNHTAACREIQVNVPHRDRRQKGWHGPAQDVVALWVWTQVWGCLGQAGWLWGAAGVPALIPSSLIPHPHRERGAEPLSGALAEGGTRFRNLQLGGCSVTLEMGAADSTSILPCLGGTGCAGICTMAGLRCQLSCVCPARGTAPLLRASPASSPCGLLDKDGRSSQPSLPLSKELWSHLCCLSQLQDRVFAKQSWRDGSWGGGDREGPVGI